MSSSASLALLIRTSPSALFGAVAGRSARQFAAAAVEPLCQGIALFFLYRLVLNALGADQLGVWALVVASLSLSQFADPGIARATPRSLAALRALTDGERAWRQALHIGNGTTLTAALYAAIGLAIWLPGHHLLGFAVPAADLPLARALLPYAIVSLVLSASAGVALQSLVAARRAGLKAGIVITAELVQLAVAAAMVGGFGLWGLLAAQAARNLVLLLAGAGAAVRLYRVPPRAFLRLDRGVARELLTFGLQLQSISVISFLYEPTTKFLLGRFGGLDSVAWFDMASRLVQQGRAAIVAANYNAVPHLTEAIMGRRHAELHRAFRLQFAATATAGTLLCLSLVLAAPLISRLWIGHAQHEFVACLVVLSAAWLVNILSVPAFMLAIACRRTLHVTVAHALIAGVNIVLGFGLGYAMGENGVVLGWALGLSAGSIIIALARRRLLGAQA